MWPFPYITSGHSLIWDIIKRRRWEYIWYVCRRDCTHIIKQAFTLEEGGKNEQRLTKRSPLKNNREKGKRSLNGVHWPDCSSSTEWNRMANNSRTIRDVWQHGKDLRYTRPLHKQHSNISCDRRTTSEHIKLYFAKVWRIYMKWISMLRRQRLEKRKGYSLCLSITVLINLTVSIL